jgi:predicted HTH domain antitoxin
MYDHTTLAGTRKLSTRIRLLAAVKMFEMGKLSLEQAAALSGVSALVFVRHCRRFRLAVATAASRDA